ncbi:MAG TPA: mannitol dehydrogenase family protein [Streptosporangiales bacterium]
MSVPRLSLRSLARLPAGARPRVDPAARRVGIVHLGIGAFHRAHQAVYTEDAGDWGSCGVTQRSAAVARQLLPQDGLYAVLSKAPAGDDVRVVGSVREVLVGPDDPGAVVARIADPAIRVVTLTVTEKGYRRDPATGRLRRDDPEVAADLAGRTPRTVVGQLVAGLDRRRRTDAGPLTVVCCDNLPANGPALRRLVTDYVADDALAAWIGASVRFPATMVDRIVPATTDADRAEVTRLLGVADDGAVVAEPFSQWVIEDDFAADRPAWEKAGAILTADVAPYETVKLRMLNGAHSTLAYLGALAGHEHIADAVADPVLAEVAGRLMTDDVVPTLAPPAGLDLADYGATVLDRFANPALRHTCRQVAMDGTQKLPQRLLGTAVDRLAAGAEPSWVAFAVAAWMRYVSAGHSEDGRPIAVDDPLADRLASALAGGTEPAAVVDRLVSLDEVFGELGGSAAFRDLLVGHLGRLAGDGVREACRGALRA